MSLVSVTRSLLAEKLFEAQFDQTPLPITTAGQIARVLALVILAAFCLGQFMKPAAIHSIVTHSSMAAPKLAAR